MNKITNFISSFFSSPKILVNELEVNNLNIYFFSASWCPHSTKIIPNFKEFVSLFNNQIIRGYKINCIDVDCTEPEKNAALIKKLAIEYYPCIKIVKDGLTIDFSRDTKITQENLIKFVNSVVN